MPFRLDSIICVRCMEKINGMNEMNKCMEKIFLVKVFLTFVSCYCVFRLYLVRNSYKSQWCTYCVLPP